MFNQSNFQKNLAFGQQAETEIAKWMMKRGHLILPVYDIEYETGKGPRVFAKDAQYVAPDLLVLKNGNGLDVLWIEAKHKTVFTWHRITEKWTTGIDRHHYHSYIALQDRIPIPIWLLFLHKSKTPDIRDLKAGCPSECPVGLFGERLVTLKQCPNHEHPNWGKHGMVYWNYKSLKLLAPLEELVGK